MTTPIGMMRPLFPLDAMSVRLIRSPICLSGVVIMDHFKPAISFARNPARTDSRNCCTASAERVASSS